MKHNEYHMIMALLLIISCSPNQKIQNDWEGCLLHGKVESVKTVSTGTEQGFAGKSAENEAQKNSLIRFNQNGFIEEILNFSPSNALIEKNIWYYNNDNVLQCIKYFDKFEHSEATKHYDYYPSGIIKSQKTFNADGKPLSTEIYENDGTFVTRKTFYNGNGSISHQEVLDYRRGKLSSTTLLDSLGMIQKKVNIVSSRKGLTTKAVSSQSIFVLSVEYDKHNNPLKVKNGRWSQSFDLKFTFDDKGDQTYYYVYLYDSHENWIQCIEYANDFHTPIRTIKRAYTYFE